MTCRNAFYRMHAEMEHEAAVELFKKSCPDDFGYAGRPDTCFGSNRDCVACWERQCEKKITFEKGCEDKLEPMTTKKTKAELMEELEAANKTKDDLEKQLTELEKYKTYRDCGDELKAVHTAFMDSGFSSEQAFSLMQTMLFQATTTSISTNIVRDLSRTVNRRK